MSETETGGDANSKLGAGWAPAADGASVSRTYELGSASEAVKLAKRVLQLAEKAKEAVRLDYSGSRLTVGLPASGGKVSDGGRRMARRLDGDKAERKSRPATAPADDRKAKREAREARAARQAKKKAKKADA